MVLDTGNRSGYNLISANVVSRYKLKKSKRRPLGLRTFNDVKKTYNYEVTIRLSLLIIRYEKETYNTTFELNCPVRKDLSTDHLISDRSIHKFGLFTRQISV